MRISSRLALSLVLPLSLVGACGSNPGGGGDDGPDVDAGAIGGDIDAGASSGDVDAGTGDGDASVDVTTDRCGTLRATLRDFRADHPDFENPGERMGNDIGVVGAGLGGDDKPVYAHAGATRTVESPASFAQWYRDVADVNMTFEEPLPLTETSDGVFVFEDADFFPLDGKGFAGEERDGHNYHFTTEIHATFQYRGGEKFRFTGDDDVWVFVNRKLALDLGGVHGAQDFTIDFDARAAELGITTGEVYSLDVFHAERHLSRSNFRIETSISCFLPVD